MALSVGEVNFSEFFNTEKAQRFTEQHRELLKKLKSLIIKKNLKSSRYDIDMVYT